MHRLAVVAVLVISSTAFAERTKKDDGGSRGRLGAVSSGIKAATAKAPSSTSSSSSSSSHDEPRHVRRDEPRYYSESPCCYATTYEEPSSPAAPGPGLDIDVGLQGSAAVQKVFESGGSIGASLALVIEHKVRFTGRIARYFEDEPMSGRVEMTMPQLTIGARIGDFGPTALWIDAGLANVRTHDPEGDVSLLGTAVGATLSHELSPDVTLIAAAGAQLFDEVRAYSGRAAVRLHHVELGFSVLDFNVGPALFGPELGIGF